MGSTVSWIIVVIVVIVVIALIAMMLNKRKAEQNRAQAEGLRSEARGQTADVHESHLRAQEAEADAERRRVEAERAEQQAAQARQGAQVDQAQHEDQLREADRLDPDVDTRSADYQPDTGIGSGGTPGASENAGYQDTGYQGTDPSEDPEGGSHRA